MKKMNVFSDYFCKCNTNLVPHEFDLMSIPLTHTSAGMLRKWWSYKNGISYLIKTGVNELGLYSNLQPVAESLASDIGNLLGLTVAEYKLATINLESNQEILVTSSRNFLEKGEELYSMYTLLKSFRKKTNNESMYDYCLSCLSNYGDFQNDLNRMVIFDYIIGNCDRHLNNFCLTKDINGKFKFSVLFDHGDSLLSRYHIDTIESSWKRICIGYDCKPFRATHEKQIKLVQDISSLNINLNINKEIVKNTVLKYEQYIDRKRCMKIYKFVCYRLEEVRRLCQKSIQ